MNTDELVGLTQWIDAEIRQREIITLYSDLVEILQNNAHSTPSRPFSLQKEELKAALGAVDLDALSHEQIELLARLGIAEYVGEGGANALDDILVKAGLDISTAWAKISEARDKIQKGLERSNQIKKSLSGLIHEGDTSEDRPRIRVSFKGRASIENLVDLKKWSAEWHEIGRGIAMSQGAAPEDIAVVEAHKGSIIITLATTYGIVKVVAEVLLKSLEVAQKTLDIQKTVQEIRSLKLANEKLARDLENEIAGERKKGIERISHDVAEASLIKKEEEGDKIVALTTSVKKLVAFLEKGGNVDLLLPKSLEQDDADDVPYESEMVKELKGNIRQIRFLESKVKRIEHLDSDVDEP